MIAVDPLTEFLNNCSPAEVELERLAPFANTRKESFGHRAHREVLDDHEFNRLRWRIQVFENEAFIHRQKESNT